MSATATKFKAKNKTEEFYHDVFVNFCEDPHNIFVVNEYEYDAPKPRAVVEDDEGKTFEITLDTVKTAFELNAKSKKDLKVHPSNRGRFHAAFIALDAGMMDAYDAMTLMQFAIYGEAIYG